MRWLDDTSRVVVLGPLWLGAALATRTRVLLLIEPEHRARARRVVRKAAEGGQPLLVAVAGVDLPLAPGSVDAIVVESASALDAESAARWLASVVPLLRPGGRLLAADATDDPVVEARLAGLFLGAALTGIRQTRPRDGTVLTSGAALAF